jgi:hypothetical protein
VQHLVVDGSLDSKLIRTLIAKQEIFEAGMNDPTGIDVPVLPTTPPRTMDDEVVREREVRQGAAVAMAQKYPPATEMERAAAQRAMRMLAGVCDYAQARDNAGFNGCDARIGHALAEQSRPFTDGQVALAKRLATTYRRQLPADIVAALRIEAKPRKG